MKLNYIDNILDVTLTDKELFIHEVESLLQPFALTAIGATAIFLTNVPEEIAITKHDREEQYLFYIKKNPVLHVDFGRNTLTTVDGLEAIMSRDMADTIRKVITKNR